MTIANQLIQINTTKQEIKSAIENKGVSLADVPFTSYPSKINEITGGAVSDWVRPSDWLTLPTIGSTEQKFVGLFAVTGDDSNYVALSANGAYTIDWGDGVIESYASSAKASHKYTYSSISDSTISSRGYKQVIVIVTPQIGQNLTSINLQQTHPMIPGTAQNSCWLDIVIGSPSLQYLTVGKTNAGYGVFNTMLERVNFVSTGLMYGVGFGDCAALATVNAFNTSNMTSFAYMFYNCISLKSVPELNTSKGTDFNSMFYKCAQLRSIPPLDISKGGTIPAMFAGCSSLQYLPITTGTEVNASLAGMVDQCYSLIELPNWTYSGVAFPGVTGCYNLRRIRGKSMVQNFNVSSTKLSKIAINELIENLGNASSAVTLTISTTPGAALNPTYSRSSTTTAGSATIAIADTSNFIAGETQVTGTGITNSRTVTLTDAGDTVTLVGHGLPNGKRVSFNSITTTTGIAIYNLYYVVNATTDTFQLSLTQGGTPIALTNNGTGTIIYQTLVIAIEPNVSVTVDVPASISGTSNLAYRNLNTQIAVMKRWAVSG